jgi:hypothetical protein
MDVIDACSVGLLLIIINHHLPYIFCNVMSLASSRMVPVFTMDHTVHLVHISTVYPMVSYILTSVMSLASSTLKGKR